MKILKSKLNGKIKLCPSKSYAHRYLIASMLSKGKSIISNVDMSDDIKATLSCIKSYDRKYEIDGDRVIFYEDDKIFKNKRIDEGSVIFNAIESGSTLRFFLPLAVHKYKDVLFTGSKKLMERGVGVYEKILTKVYFDKRENEIALYGDIEPDEYIIPGNISSQYATGLLFLLPLLKKNSVIKIVGNLESKNYALITLDVLHQFGIDIDIGNQTIFDKNVNLVSFNIGGNSEYKATDKVVEGDYSNAAFIDAFNYFGSSISIDGLNKNSMQGDKIYKEYFEKLDKNYCTLDISDCIDLGPILMAFATLKNGAHLMGTRRLKIKESNRANVMAEELNKFGADIEIDDNDIYINKTELHSPNEILSSHNDHRIVMALTLFSTMFDIEISGENAVNKSYPSFFEDLNGVGLNIL